MKKNYLNKRKVYKKADARFLEFKYEDVVLASPGGGSTDKPGQEVEEEEEEPSEGA